MLIIKGLYLKKAHPPPCLTYEYFVCYSNLYPFSLKNTYAMKYNSYLLPLCAVFLLGACRSVDLVADRHQIIEICQEQVNAWRTQDFQAEREVWAHKPYALKMLTTGSRTVGWDSIGHDYRTAFEASQGEAPSFNTVLSDFYVHVFEDGQSAFAVFDQHQVFETGAGQQIYETLETRCLEKIDGKWRVVFQLTGPYDQPQELTTGTMTDHQ